MSPPLDLAIVGAGPAGLAAAHFARRRGLSAEVFEAAPVPGGKVRSLREDGFIIEQGPQGWLDKEPLVGEVCSHLGIEPVASRPSAGERFVLRRGRLHPVPTGPGSFLRSPLLSLRGRLRVAAEPFIRRGRTGDESVFDFAARRIGREAAEILIDAMVSGIHAGDPRQLSLPATFPTLAELEREHGSLFRGMLARRGRSSGGPAGPGGNLLTLPGGMGSLIEALAEACGAALHLSSPVQGLKREDGGWAVLAAGGRAVRARHVLLAVPARTAAALLDSLDPALGEVAEAIPTAGLATVVAAWPRGQVRHACRGFGFLAPRCEGFRPLGVLYLHEIFPGQTPGDAVVLRIMLGGARDAAAMDLDDAGLEAAALEPLTGLLGIGGAPARVWIGRVAEAAPQYTLGHLARVARFEAAIAPHAGLHLAGDCFHGIGVNPAFRRAFEVVSGLSAARAASREARAPA